MLVGTTIDPEIILLKGSTGKWTIRKGVEVVITFIGEYYAGSVVVRITSTDPLLVLVFVL
jgi:hypothetical protein